MITWDAPCKALNCEHLYYVYGCEPECALKKTCDKLDEYRNTHDKLHKAMTCAGCKNDNYCSICSRNYRDLYNT
jgi:hypothetical protein